MDSSDSITDDDKFITDALIDYEVITNVIMLPSLMRCWLMIASPTLRPATVTVLEAPEVATVVAVKVTPITNALEMFPRKIVVWRAMMIPLEND